MRHRLARFAVAASALAVVAVLSVVPASAITGGHPDGNGHPYVAVLVDDYETPGYFQRFCSGTLVAPRLVVTASHCLLALVDPEVWVSFDSVYVPGTSARIHGTGIAAVDPAGFNPGNAGYQGGYSDIANDIAVVHLDEDAPVTQFGVLPTAGLLDSLDLEDQTWTAVGFGRTRVDKTKGPNNIESNFDPDVRNAANLGFLNLHDSFVTLSQNAARGLGGTCYGDSGGPIFLGNSNVMVATTIVGDAACRATGKYYRTDIEFARQFLASQGVPVPS